MDVVNGLFKEYEVLGRNHRLCPPASSHDGQKNTILATRWEPFLASITLSVLGEWPRLGGPPLWLTCSPPADPFKSVSVNVVDNQYVLL